MSFTGAVKSVLQQNYMNFEGRAVRSEYWYYTLFYILVVIAVAVIATIVSTVLGTKLAIYVLFGILELALFIPTLAVSVRRMHDVNRSGFWLFIYFGPWLGSMALSHVSLILGGICSLASMIGGIVLLVWCCMPGTPGANRFGGSDSFARPGPMPMPVGFN